MCMFITDRHKLHRIPSPHTEFYLLEINEQVRYDLIPYTMLDINSNLLVLSREKQPHKKDRKSRK